ncbi:MAG TPA: hypothetical protein PKG66_06385, partial [Methanothrix sp.]|nr:hypothetical protein [Methanothrix sp.]
GNSQEGNRFCGGRKSPLYLGDEHRKNCMCGADLSDLGEEKPDERDKNWRQNRPGSEVMKESQSQA